MKTRLLFLVFGTLLLVCCGCATGVGFGFQVGDRGYGTKAIDHGPGFARELDQPMTTTIVSFAY